MVERAPRRVAAVSAGPSSAYQGVAAAWARGPAALYDALATVAIAEVAHELAGATVLDVGAGTGALCRALRSAGAVPIAVDTSADMLRLAGAAAAFTVVADMCALPINERSVDAAVSGFAISHLHHPERALEEMRRVVRPHGRVVAAVFGEAPASAAKDVVDTGVKDYGYQPPDWYLELKNGTEPRSNTPALLRHCAESARLDAIEVADISVEPGLDTPEAITAYRTGLAHVAPFIAALPVAQRDELISRAVAAVRNRGQAVRPRVLVLSSRVPA